MHLCAGNGCASRLPPAEHVVDGNVEDGPAHRVEALGELARGAARGVLLACARVVDHLPGVEVPGGLGREPQDERSRDREVAGRDDADAVLASQGIDRVVLLGAEPARADDDADAPLERRADVRLDR
jgi:hypothetical protein